MKKRYFLASLLALGIIMSGCGTTSNDPYATDDHYDYFKDYDLTMFVQDAPKPIGESSSGSISWKHQNTGIANCFSFTDTIQFLNASQYGTAYYMNHQNTPVTLSIKGEDIDEQLVIPAQTSKGIVWQKTAPYGSPAPKYTVSLVSDGTETLSGSFTLVDSSCVFDLSQKSNYFDSTIVYSDFIVQKETSWQHTMTLTDEEDSGRASYTNTQDAIATINVKGNGFNKKVEVPPFTRRDIDWKKVSTGDQEYTITINCEEGHTLNGFLSLERLHFFAES